MSKYLLLYLSIICFVSGAYGQAPETFNFQAVLRDAQGAVISDKEVGLRLSIIPGKADSTAIFQESHSISTNSFGLINLPVGLGDPILGELREIQWETGVFFMELELDEFGGTDYTSIGAFQLFSVPYAMYAKTAGSLAKSIEGKLDSLIFPNKNANIEVNLTADPNYRYSFGQNPGPSAYQEINIDGKVNIADVAGIVVNNRVDNPATLGFARNIGFAGLAENGVYNSGAAFTGRGGLEPKGVEGLATADEDESRIFGFSGFANALPSITPQTLNGGQFWAEGVPSFASYGVRGVARGVENAPNNGNELFYGVYGNALWGVKSYGVYGLASFGSVANYGVFGEALFTAGTIGYAGYFQGNVEVTGLLTKGGGTFKIDHPLEPSKKYLSHSFVESPDMMNIYNGNITTDERGFARVALPSYFEALNIEYKYQLTVIGSFAQAIIAEEVSNGKFVIQTDRPEIKVSWQVTGVRNDRWAQENRVIPETDKTKDEIGHYLHPELFGKGKELRVHQSPKTDLKLSKPQSPKK